MAFQAFTRCVGGSASARDPPGWFDAEKATMSRPFAFAA